MDIKNPEILGFCQESLDLKFLRIPRLFDGSSHFSCIFLKGCFYPGFGFFYHRWVASSMDQLPILVVLVFDDK